MSDYETRMADEDALQLKQQRFTAALKFTMYYLDTQGRYDHGGIGVCIDDGIEDADTLIAKLEAPTE